MLVLMSLLHDLSDFLLTYCPGNLLNTLQPGGKPLNWPLRVRMAFDAAKGMRYLHRLEPPLLHRDLKVRDMEAARCDQAAPSRPRSLPCSRQTCW